MKKKFAKIDDETLAKMGEDAQFAIRNYMHGTHSKYEHKGVELYEALQTLVTILADECIRAAKTKNACEDMWTSSFECALKFNKKFEQKLHWWCL